MSAGTDWRITPEEDQTFSAAIRAAWPTPPGSLEAAATILEAAGWTVQWEPTPPEPTRPRRFTASIGVALTPAERTYVLAQAAYAGMSVSAFMRGLLARYQAAQDAPTEGA